MKSKHITNATSLEKITGGLALQSALTVVGAISGGALAPLLPVLANTIAAKRNQQRIEKELETIQGLLSSQQERLNTLTLDQYKLINETVLAVLYTTQEEKLQLLRNVIHNAFSHQSIQSRETTMLSRIIRDISAEEAQFLLRTFSFKGIKTSLNDDSGKEDIYSVKTGSDDAINMSGLLSLGILIPAEATWGGIGVMHFSPLAAKLIVLLREPIT